MSTTTVRIEHFGKRYRKERWAVAEVSLQAQKGEIYGLIGPDGAGKSSLMKAVAGVMSYEKGEVWVFDTLVNSEASAEKVKARLGFMPQGLGLNLYPDLSIEENIDFFAQLRDVPPNVLAQRKAQLLEMTQLTPFKARAMKHLSGGMKQKLGLVCTLIHQPELIILDEPTTGVDPVSRRDFWQILNTLVQQEQVTALVSTAYMDEASRFHHLSVMNRGQVIHQGTLDEILGTTPGVIAELTTSMPAEQLQQQLAPIIAPFGTSVRIEAVGQALRVISFAHNEKQLAADLQQWFETCQCPQPNSVQWLPMELEAAFIYWIQQNEENGAQTPPNPTQKDLKNTNISRIPSPAETARQTLIQAKGLTRRFGDFTAVDHINFEVKAGEIFGLLGANGAGKSTAIKMLTSILPPSEGEGLIAGVTMQSNQSLIIRQQIGYMSQAFSLYLDLSVEENLRLFGQIYGLSGRKLKQRVEWALEMGHLQPQRQQLASRLPMGKRQRLALGCALLHQPKVLFLDEPTSGVDPIGRLHFWQLLTELIQQMEVAILVTTHYMSEAEHCHHLALMQAGRIIAQDAPNALKERLKQQKGIVLSVQVKQPYEAQAALESAGFDEIALFGNQVHLFTQTPEETYQQVSQILQNAGIAIEAHWQLQPSLEDVFIHTLESASRKGGIHAA